jgi:hypothetical protein
MESFNLNNNLKLTAPDNWQIETEKNVTSLFDPNNGVGALQFSLYQVPNINSIDLIEELKQYMADKYDDVNVNLVDSYAYSDVTDKDKYWRYWLLKAGGIVIFASYNCAENDKNIETFAVDTIIKSISTG